MKQTVSHRKRSIKDHTGARVPMNPETNSRRILASVKSKADARRTFADRTADFFTNKLGSMAFLGINVLWFSVWIPVNLNLIPGITAFDPFPFGLLTMIVSLEAIILAIIVLISQNREENIANLREEIDLQVNIITEQEITKVLQLLTLLLKKKGIRLHDPVLESMTHPTNVRKIEKSLNRQITPKK